ncbi:hypothetical protein O181_006342 [Austropuccinia psidii MF-1]|uniref:Uncharacterized protein n=1 Tax=Austropuccinia psidii MF-1 TaxID=1389203 RepID=A0A9Q3BJW4_9BASI|nr:hypothetical protein [Austropuccinia psidii MF-1]
MGSQLGRQAARRDLEASGQALVVEAKRTIGQLLLVAGGGEGWPGLGGGGQKNGWSLLAGGGEGGGGDATENADDTTEGTNDTTEDGNEVEDDNDSKSNEESTRDMNEGRNDKHTYEQEGGHGAESGSTTKSEDCEKSAVGGENNGHRSSTGGGKLGGYGTGGRKLGSYGAGGGASEESKE